MASIREQLSAEPEAVAEATRVHEFLQNLNSSQWKALMDGLARGDKEGVAKLFGMTASQMDDAFKALKGRATALAEKHPELLTGGKS